MGGSFSPSRFLDLNSSHLWGRWHLFNNFLISNHLEQLINDRTDVRDDGFQSCIDLICTDQPFSFTETGVFSSLDTHSKHNFPHGTLNMGIPPSPTFKRKIWDYKSAKIDHIRLDLHKINWHNLFLNLNVSEKSILFTDTFLDIMAKHIPSKIITCNLKKSKLQSNIIIEFIENGLIEEGTSAI